MLSLLAPRSSSQLSLPTNSSMGLAMATRRTRHLRNQLEPATTASVSSRGGRSTPRSWVVTIRLSTHRSSRRGYRDRGEASRARKERAEQPACSVRPRVNGPGGFVVLCMKEAWKCRLPGEKPESLTKDSSVSYFDRRGSATWTMTKRLLTSLPLLWMDSNSSIVRCSL